MKKILFVVLVVALFTSQSFLKNFINDTISGGNSSTVSKSAVNVATSHDYDKTYFNHALYDTPYIGNAYRKTFHHRDCESVAQMLQENQVPLKSLAEAKQKGFRPCGNCRPDLDR